MAALNEIKPRISDIKQKKEELTEIKNNIDSENSFLRVLTDLYKLTPKNVMYENFNFEKQNKVELRGKAVKHQEVLDLVTILKDSNYFQDAELLHSRGDRLYRAAVRSFDIACYLESNQEYRKPRKSRGR